MQIYFCANSLACAVCFTLFMNTANVSFWELENVETVDARKRQKVGTEHT